MHGGAAIWESGAGRRCRARKLAPHREKVGGAVLHQLLHAVLLQGRGVGETPSRRGRLSIGSPAAGWRACVTALLGNGGRGSSSSSSIHTWPRSEHQCGPSPGQPCARQSGARSGAANRGMPPTAACCPPVSAGTAERCAPAGYWARAGWHGRQPCVGGPCCGCKGPVSAKNLAWHRQPGCALPRYAAPSRLLDSSTTKRQASKAHHAHRRSQDGGCRGYWSQNTATGGS